MFDCCAGTSTGGILSSGSAGNGGDVFVPASGYTLPLKFIDHDDIGGFNLTLHNDRFTAPSDGIYLLGCQIDLDVHSATYTQLQFDVEFTFLGVNPPGATARADTSVIAAAEVELCPSGLVSMAAGDYTQVAVIVTGTWTGTVEISGVLWYVKIK